MTEDRRRYDDREVGLILKRVAELHERGGDKADARALSVQEIEAVVAELGIPRALVAQAVSDIAIQDIRNKPVWWLGGKTDLLFEGSVEGTVDDATVEEMVEVLRRLLGNPGELRTEGSARIWSTGAGTSRKVHLTLSETRGTTRVRLEERMPIDARTTAGGGTAAGFATGVMAAVPVKALVGKAVLMMALGPMMAGGALVGWLAGRAVWKRRSGARERHLRDAFSEIMVLARSAAAPNADAQ